MTLSQLLRLYHPYETRLGKLMLFIVRRRGQKPISGGLTHDTFQRTQCVVHILVTAICISKHQCLDRKPMDVLQITFIHQQTTAVMAFAVTTCNEVTVSQNGTEWDQKPLLLTGINWDKGMEKGLCQLLSVFTYPCINPRWVSQTAIKVRV